MARFQQQPSRTEPQAEVISALASTVAPEDIRLGDFVTLLHAICELPSYLWCADAITLPAHELVRLQFIPQTAGIPLRVKAICLPFVLTKSPRGVRETLDVRRCRLARLDRKYAQAAWKANKQSTRKSKRRRR